jgi:hypothetical protein
MKTGPKEFKALRAGAVHDMLLALVARPCAALKSSRRGKMNFATSPQWLSNVARSALSASKRLQSFSASSIGYWPSLTLRDDAATSSSRNRESMLDDVDCLAALARISPTAVSVAMLGSGGAGARSGLGGFEKHIHLLHENMM